MKFFKNKQMSETYLTGVLLALAGGYLDAYTYISRGGVFANAQTGNIVLMGINAAEGDYKKALYYVFPIVAFIIGVFLTELIKSKYKQNNKLHWRQLVITAEIVMLTIVGFIPTGKYNVLATIIISFVCSMQTKGFRKINGNAVSTTMCTGNLRSASELFYAGIKEKKKKLIIDSLQYFGIIAFFIAGGALGTLLTIGFSTQSIFFVCIIFIIEFLIMFKKENP